MTRRMRRLVVMLASTAAIALLLWPVPRMLPLSFRLAYPEARFLVALLPLCWYLWTARERRPAIRFSSLADLRAAGGAGRARLRGALPALRSAALVSLIVAVARPQRADESSRTFAEGIAIQMVLDTSGSMRDEDLAPRGSRTTRLDVVKRVFERFVKGDGKLPGRPNDLIGMIRFAQFADSVCPLTLDHKNLLRVLDETRISDGDEGNATAIGDGLALAVERLRDLKRTIGSGEQHVIKSKVVILLSDGEDNASQIKPEQAGDLAATYGIKVYTIMAGTGGRDVFGRRIPVDDSVLKEIAAKSGGRFYHARNAAALEKVYEEIDSLERTRTEERRYVAWGELSFGWLAAAFACVALQSLLDATFFRKIP